MTATLIPTGFLDWPGWEFVGALAGVLSLVAIVLALVEVRRRRQRVNPVVFTFDLVGNAEVRGDTVHYGELTNAGTESAILLHAVWRGGMHVPTDKYRYRSVIGPGERVGVYLSAPVIANMWLSLMWISHDDASTLWFSWLPVLREGGRADQWEEALARSKKRWWERKTRLARPVGPLHYTWATWSRSNAADKINQIMLEGSAGEKLNYSWPPRADKQQEFPFVDE
jgi:hypothetical protein